MPNVNSAQARYWLLTIPHANFLPYLPPGVTYIKGQLERGEGLLDGGSDNIVRHEGDHVENCIALWPELGAGECQCRAPSKVGYLHWQVVVVFARKLRLRGVRAIFGSVHCEPTRSSDANEYVWKDETSVAGTRFQLGDLPFRRGVDKDWAEIKRLAIAGQLDDIPCDVYVRNYHALKRYVFFC